MHIVTHISSCKHNFSVINPFIELGWKIRISSVYPVHSLPLRPKLPESTEQRMQRWQVFKSFGQHEIIIYVRSSVPTYCMSKK